MASSFVSIMVVVLGVAAAFSVYSVVLDPSESDVELTYSDGAYHYSGSFSDSLSDTSFIRSTWNIDDLKDYGLSINMHPQGTYPYTSSTDFSEWFDGVAVDAVFTLTDSQNYTIDITLTDGEDHSVYVKLCPTDSDGIDIVETQDFTFDLAADGSSIYGSLLLAKSSFMATFAAGVVFVCFVVFAIILYAGGGRR